MIKDESKKIVTTDSETLAFACDSGRHYANATSGPP
jgi:hypothetical protein